MKFYQVVLIRDGEREPLPDMFDSPTDAQLNLQIKKRAHPEREYKVEEIDL